MIITPQLLKSTFILLALLPHIAFGARLSFSHLIDMGCIIDKKNKHIVFKPGVIQYTDENQPYFTNNAITYYLTQHSTEDNSFLVSGLEGEWHLQVFPDPQPNLVQEPAIATNQSTSTFIMPDFRIPPPGFTYSQAYDMELGLPIPRYQKEANQPNQSNQQLEALLSRKNEEIKQLNQKLEALLAKNKEEVQQLNQKLKQDKAKSEEESTSLKKEAFNLKQKIKYQENQSMQSEKIHQSTKDELETKNGELLEDKKNLQLRIERASEEQTGYLTTIRTQENMIDQLKKEKKTADTKNQELQRKTESQKDEMEQGIAKSKEEAENLKKKILDLNQKIKYQTDQLMQSNKKHQSTQDELEKTNSELLEAKKKLQHPIERSSKEQEDSLATIQIKNKMIAQLEKEKNTADIKNKELQSKTENQKAEINQLKANLKKTKQHAASTEAIVTERESELAENKRFITLLKNKITELKQEKEKIANNQPLIDSQQKPLKKSRIEPSAPPPPAENISKAQPLSFTQQTSKDLEQLMSKYQKKWSKITQQLNERSTQLEAALKEGEQIQTQLAIERKKSHAVSSNNDPVGRLEALGMFAQHTPADGACLLHAVIQGLEDSPDITDFIQLLTQYLLSPQPDLQNLIQQAIDHVGASSQELIHQLLNLQTPSADNPERWGDHRLYALIAIVLQRPILLVLTNGSLGREGEESLFAIQFSPDSTTPAYLATASISEILQNPEQSNTLLIGLYQTGEKGMGNHFFQLKRKPKKKLFLETQV